MIYGQWEKDQQNEIKFVMVSSAGAEVAGLGSGYTLEISKPGNTAFVASAGTKQEISDGWYRYVSTAGEADTIGSVAIKVTGAGAVQQNLEYVVEQRALGVAFFPYQVTDGVNPVAGVTVWVTTDAAGAVRVGQLYLTDASGNAKDSKGNDPILPLGVVYFWKYKLGWSDDDNPDMETVT